METDIVHNDTHKGEKLIGRYLHSFSKEFIIAYEAALV
jgi:hypothetical protein